jgi:peptidoglycan/xylan/chitin deacetylase (PgdA/CDA1 family)
MAIEILMYHYVRDNEDYPYNVYGRRESDFCAQIDFLLKCGEILNPADIDRINSCLKSETQKSFLLTFDDGYKDHLYCAQYLNSHGVSGLFFPPINAIEGELLDVNAIHLIIGTPGIDLHNVISLIREMCMETGALLKLNHKVMDIDLYLERFDETSRFDSRETLLVKRMLQRDIADDSRRRSICHTIIASVIGVNPDLLSKELYLSKSELVSMKSLGMYFGSHGLTHRWLETLAKHDQINEIRESFCKLRSYSVVDNSDPKVLCYPFGSYNQCTFETAESEQIDYALSTKVGSALLSRDQGKYNLYRWDTNDFWDEKWRMPALPKE